MSNPYVGPQAFQEADFERFHGRRQETADLLALLTARRLVLFYAQSGAGKSSLINARLRPLLQQERGFELLPVGRVTGNAPEGVQVDNIYLFNLMASLDEGATAPERLAELRLSDFLLDLARVNGRYIYLGEEAETDEEAEAWSLADEPVEIRPRALIIDQFEELFSTHPEAYEARGDFFAQLAEAMADDPYLYVLLSMREDFLARLSPYAHLLPGELRSRYYMQRMQPEAALKAVRRPAKAGGRPFAPGVAEELVEHLRRVRVQAEGGEEKWAPGEFVEPVQLQVVCFQLWENLNGQAGPEITIDDLTDVARRALAQGEGEVQTTVTADPLEVFVEQSLAAYYEQSLATVLANPSVDVSESYLRDWFSHKLITSAGTRGFLPRGEQETAGIPESVIECLEKQHLIRGDSRSAGQWVELVHDSFIEPIRRANRQWNEQRAQQLPWLAAAYRWSQEPHADLLLRGKALESALLEAGDLTNQPRAVRKFLEASQKVEREAERRWAQRLRTAAIVLFIIVVLAIFGWVRANRVSGRLADTVAELEEKETELETANRELQDRSEELEDSNMELEEERAELVQARIAAQQAQRAAQAAEAEARALRLAERAGIFLDRGNVAAALLAALAPDSPPTAAIQATLLRGLNQAVSGAYRSPDAEAVLKFRRDDLAAPAVISDTLFAGPTANALAAIADGDIVWWEQGVEQPLAHTFTLSPTTAVRSAAFSPDGSLLVTADEETLALWQVAADGARLLESISLPVQRLAFSPDGNRLALALCDPSNTEVRVSQQPVAGGATATCGSSLIQILSIVAGSRFGDQPQLVSTEKDSIAALLFAGPDLLLWSTPQRVSAQSFNGDRELELPAPEEGERYRALAVIDVDGSNWLLVATCPASSTAAGCGQDGAVRWWSLDDGVWLTPRIPLPDAPTALHYMPTPQLLVAARGTDHLIQWEAAPARWRYLACRIAGRNMSAAEWRETFPYAEGSPRRICPLVGLDLSFAQEHLLTCEALDEARVLYGRSARPVVDGEQLPFEEWAVPLLLEEALATGRSQHALACLDTANELSSNADRFDPERFLQLKEELGVITSSAADGDAAASLQRLTDLREQLGPLSPVVVAAFESRLGSRYDQLCTALPAGLAGSSCEGAPLQYGDWIAEAGPAQLLWQFDGEEGDFVSVAMDSLAEGGDPLLTLRDANGAFVASDDDGGGNLNARLQLLLPASGRYLLEAGWYGQPGNYSLSLDGSRTELLDFPTTVSEADSSQTVWSFDGGLGDFVEITMDALDTGSNPYLILRDANGYELARDDNSGDGVNARLQQILPADGRYLVEAWWTSEPGRYALSLLPVEPLPLTIGSRQEAGPEQRLWQFQGSRGDFLSIAMDSLELDGDPLLTLWNESGEEIGSDDDGGGDRNALLYTTLPADGIYRINAGWIGEPAPYAISLQRSEAALLDIPTSLPEVAPEQRLWQFEGRQGEALDIIMETLDEDGDPLLILWDANGEEIARDDDSGGELNARLQAILPADGTYYLETTWFGLPLWYSLVVQQLQTEVVTLPAELPLDEAFIWPFRGEAGERVHINVESPVTEEAVLSVRGRGSEVLAGGTRGLLLELPASATYTVAVAGPVSPDGMLRLQALPPALYELQPGQVGEGALADGRTDFWSISSDVQPALVITLTEEVAGVSLFLYGPEGELVQAQQTARSSLLMAGLPLSGTYTLALHGPEVAYQMALTDEAPIPQVCAMTPETVFYGPLGAGSRVVLGAHRESGGSRNWNEAMEEYVGQEATVTGLVGVDDQGCPVVRVDVDDGQWAWRIRDLTLLGR